MATERGEGRRIDLGTRLKLPSRFIKAGAISAEKHMIAAKYEELKAGTKVRLLMMLKRHDITKEMFDVVAADKGKNFIEKAKEDTRQILSVRLPEEFKGLGPESGEKLFQLQCQTLK